MRPVAFASYRSFGGRGTATRSPESPELLADDSPLEYPDGETLDVLAEAPPSEVPDPLAPPPVDPVGSDPRGQTCV